MSSQPVVFVSDADSDSGKAVFLRFAREGARLVLNSRSSGAAIGAELEAAREQGADVCVVDGDLSDGAEVERVLRLAERESGPIGVFVHNPDLLIPAAVETCAEEIFLDVMNANAKSAFLCVQAVGKRMAAREAGAIVLVTSVHAEKPTGSSFAYSASKGAVKMLAKEAAVFLGRFGITVNTVEPGAMEGDGSRFRSSVSALYEDYEYKVPNAVPGAWEELAHVVSFLASDRARFVNGTDIRLDGGFLLHYMDHKMKRPK
ncbi:SDR family oxidoreductase [Cohnella algarum]|uniref:SDR family NAD(P)-dependent oxidoreductase n=1 Tax=Cohnella algarum TaxID=2044859 RepID=UPI0030840028